MDTVEIVEFIRAACEEKQEREKLVRKDWRSVEALLDHIENLTNYLVEQMYD